MQLLEIINLVRGFGFLHVFERLRRLSGNFILLKASLFNKGLPFRARPSQSGLPSASPAMWGGVGMVMRIIVPPVGWCRFLENESSLWFRWNKIWRFTECMTPYNRPSEKAVCSERARKRVSEPSFNLLSFDNHVCKCIEKLKCTAFLT